MSRAGSVASSRSSIYGGFACGFGCKTKTGMVRTFRSGKGYMTHCIEEHLEDDELEDMFCVVLRSAAEANPPPPPLPPVVAANSRRGRAPVAPTPDQAAYYGFTSAQPGVAPLSTSSVAAPKRRLVKV